MLLFMNYALASAILFSLSATAADAFSPEMLNQVIAQIGGIGDLQAADLAFAAANLLDSSLTQDGQRKIVMPMLRRMGKGRRDLPKLRAQVIARRRKAPVYDYETDQTVQTSLDLTPREEVLIQLLRRVRDQYSPSTTMRIAGGWVRDKLLYGKDTPSRDIDLVLSDTSGEEFAYKLLWYCETSVEDEAANIQIQQQSKSKGAQAGHLQTASLLINGFDVDFCRLRYEKYKNKESRIPTDVGVASVVEDAWRRDLTINALYYNINTNQVEDWTERGIADLLLQSISTPKDPLKTLLEDPIRIMRAIRFAAQLSFDMNPALVRAARDDRVREALQYKVSRDAIGSAIDEMLGTRARDPSRGIQLLMATNLIDVVFPLGGQNDNNGGDETTMIGDIVDSMTVSTPTTIYRAGLASLMRTQSLITRIFLQSDFEWNISKRRYLWYAALFKPVYEMMMPTSISKRGRRESAFYQLLDDALRRPKTDVQSIETILKGVDPIQATLLEEAHCDAMQSALYFDARSRDDDVVPPRSLPIHDFYGWGDLSEIRWSVYRALKPIGTLWKEALILTLACSPHKTLADCVDQYKDLALLIEDRLQLGALLRDENKLKPLLNGSQIQKVLGRIDGKGFKQVTRAVEEWQIRNVFHDIDGIGNGERKQMESDLINCLVATFPQYSNSTGIT
ncbi:hypothetical protein ACHAWF_017306 [Thalassiosira exigua]